MDPCVVWVPGQAVWGWARLSAGLQEGRHGPGMVGLNDRSSEAVGAVEQWEQ